MSCSATDHPLDQALLLPLNLPKLLRHVQTIQAVVQLTRDCLGAQKIVEQPSLS